MWPWTPTSSGPSSATSPTSRSRASCSATSRRCSATPTRSAPRPSCWRRRSTARSTKVVGIEARGFILGGADRARARRRLRAGAQARQAARGTRTRTATSSSTAATRSRCTATRSTPDDRVLIVDDVLATGGTATATCRLVSEFFDATVVGVSFLLELTALGGRERLVPLGHHLESVLVLSPSHFGPASSGGKLDETARPPNGAPTPHHRGRRRRTRRTDRRRHRSRGRRPRHPARGPHPPVVAPAPSPWSTASSSTRARTRSTAAGPPGRRSPASASRRRDRRPTRPTATASAPTARWHPLPGSAASLVRTRARRPAAKLELARLLARPARLAGSVEPGASLQQWIDGRSRDADVRTLLALAPRVATYCGDLDGLDAAAGVATSSTQAVTHGVVYLDGGLRNSWSTGCRRRRGSRGRHDPHEREGRRGRRDARCVRRPHAARRSRRRRGRARGGGPADSTAAARRERSGRAVGRRELPVARVRARPRVAPRSPTRTTAHVRARRPALLLGAHAVGAARADGHGEVAHLLWYGDRDRRPRARSSKALLDRAQPGWRDEVVDQRYGRRLVVAHGRPRPGSGFAGRPPVAVPDVPGLFVAGDWVGAEGLLTDAVFASGRAAGRAAAQATTTNLRLHA